MNSVNDKFYCSIVVTLKATHKKLRHLEETHCFLNTAADFPSKLTQFLEVFINVGDKILGKMQQVSTKATFPTMPLQLCSEQMVLGVVFTLSALPQGVHLFRFVLFHITANAVGCGIRF